MIVYFHRNPTTYEIFYVGIASELGRAQRPYKKTHRNNYWHHYVNKHGGFIVDIVGGNLSIGEATILERFYISIFGKKINGGRLVNLADGGETNAGYKWTDLQKEKLSFAAKKRGNIRLQAPEIRAKAANTLSLKFKGRFKGIENPNYGNKWTEEMKQALSKKKKEHFSKIPSRKKVYQKLPEEERKKIVYEAMVNSWGRKVVCSETGIIFRTIVEAAKSIGMKKDTLRHKLNGVNPNNTGLIYFTPRGVLDD